MCVCVYLYASKIHLYASKIFISHTRFSHSFRYLVVHHVAPQRLSLLRLIQYYVTLLFFKISSSTIFLRYLY